MDKEGGSPPITEGDGKDESAGLGSVGFQENIGGMISTQPGISILPFPSPT